MFTLSSYLNRFWAKLVVNCVQYCALERQYITKRFLGPTTEAKSVLVHKYAGYFVMESSQVVKDHLDKNLALVFVHLSKMIQKNRTYSLVDQPSNVMFISNFFEEAQLQFVNIQFRKFFYHSDLSFRNNRTY